MMRQFGRNMTADDYNAEHQHEYELRLGMMGLGPNDMPTAEQHNHAVATADAHIAALKKENRDEALSPLLSLRDSL
jgi:hypothetical protein